MRNSKQYVLQSSGRTNPRAGEEVEETLLKVHFSDREWCQCHTWLHIHGMEAG